MENITYDALYLTPNNGDSETYSKLSSSTVQLSPKSHIRTQIQLQNKPDRVQSEINAVKNGVMDMRTPGYWRKMVLVAFVLLVTILVLTSLVSIALSVAAYAQGSSNDRSELDIMNQELSSIQTQLATTQINMSKIRTKLDNFISTVNENLQIQSYCGPGQWQRVAYLNMSDPTEQCPTAWELYNTSAVRACGRPQSDALSNEQNCPATAYSTNYQYSRVCGRVIGYQVGTPDAFSSVQNTFELDGIVISHGTQHNYLWSYVAGWTESQSSRYYTSSRCPCIRRGRQPPQYVGDNYYCESGNPSTNYNNILAKGHFYTSDKLWDGEQCEGSCCTGKFPPWFSVRLPVPTNDSIQVHICCDQPTSDEDIPIELLELYVQ